jgi:hypothetical protein
MLAIAFFWVFALCFASQAVKLTGCWVTVPSAGASSIGCCCEGACVAGMMIMVGCQVTIAVEW